MIKPFGINILVKPTEKKQVLVSDSGNLCEYGEVIAIGDKVEKVKVGQKIGYTIWGINRLEVEGTKHYLIPEDDRFILAYLNE